MFRIFSADFMAVTHSDSSTHWNMPYGLDHSIATIIPNPKIETFRAETGKKISILGLGIIDQDGAILELRYTSGFGHFSVPKVIMVVALDITTQCCHFVCTLHCPVYAAPLDLGTDVVPATGFYYCV